MINLLPEDSKKEIRAARANVVLLRYNFLSIITVALVVLSCGVFYFIMHNTQSDAVTTSQDNSARAASYESVRKNADEYRNNLLVASQILKNETHYTDIFFAVTKLLPTGVIMDNITLNASDIGKQTTFTAHVNSFAKSAELKQSFQNSSLFTNVYLQSVTDEGDEAKNKAYPIAVILSAQTKKDAQ